MPEINTAVTVQYVAWDTSANAGKTGDVANHTLRIISDGTASAPAASPAEIDATNCPGVYKIIIAAGENDGNFMTLAGASSTANISLIPISWTNKVNVTQVGGSAAAATIADAVWDEVLSSGAHATLFSAGKRLQNVVLRGGTAISGGANYIEFPGPWSSTDGIYEENIVSIVDGTGAAQTRLITEYIGSSRIAYVDRDWEVIPDHTSEIELLPFSGVLLSQHGIAAAGAASSITLASTASATSATYVGSVIYISSGTGSGQVRLITAYDGATKVATVSDTWTTTPDNTSVYKVLPVGRTIVDTLAADALAAINAEVVDTLNVDTYAEPGQGIPPATASLVAKIGYLFKAWRNRKTATATTATLYADDGTTADQASTISDDGSTFTYGEWGTGA